MGLDDFARVPLLFGPSPVHPLPRLSAALGGGVEIWAKREDCNSGIAFGGNKVRKLEYLAAEALAQGCDTLVSIGGVQSNHTRQVTGVARHLGLEAVTVQEHWVDWPDPSYEIVGNVQLTRIMGGDVRLGDAGFDIGVRDSWKAALESVTAAGGRPYPIPAGASDHPLGGLGFANWAREVAAQEAELEVRPDFVVPEAHREQRVVIPVNTINRAVVQAVVFGRTLATDVRAVFITEDSDVGDQLRRRWERQVPGVPLVIVESPFRALVGPLTAYLDVLDLAWPPDKPDPVTIVVLPEFVARHWWDRLLYNQSAKRLKSALVGREHTVIADVPYRRGH